MMACKICGRISCTECFHSIEAQEEFEQKEKEGGDIDPDYEAMRQDLIPVDEGE